jgi:ABC-2 type transport system ATP-binding protein
MLEAHELNKRFDRIHAVKDVSFRVEPGEVLGFLGPNGAGKSTTMRMLTGFLTPTSGTARVCGHDILAAPIAARTCIGYLPENAPVYDDMTVLGFLRFIAEARGFSGPDKITRIRKAVELSRLDGVLNQSIDTLSKGFKQRVCLAQAILHDPPVLILDEPTDGLDPNQKHVVRTMIRNMAASKAIILSTHILEEVEAVCTRVLIIANGRLVANGTPASLKQQNEWNGAVDMTFPESTGDLTPLFEGLPGCKRVEKRLHRYILFPNKPGRLPQETTALLTAKGLSPLSLSVAEGRLDEVFRNLTAGSEKTVPTN